MDIGAIVLTGIVSAVTTQVLRFFANRKLIERIRHAVREEFSRHNGIR